MLYLLGKSTQYQIISITWTTGRRPVKKLILLCEDYVPLSTVRGQIFLILVQYVVVKMYTFIGTDRAHHRLQDDGKIVLDFEKISDLPYNATSAICKVYKVCLTQFYIPDLCTLKFMWNAFLNGRQLLAILVVTASGEAHYSFPGFYGLLRFTVQWINTVLYLHEPQTCYSLHRLETTSINRELLFNGCSWTREQRELAFRVKGGSGYRKLSLN